jgi:short-subunit dehydrogenase
MKKVFITGASSGIGKALALAYAKRGYSVGLTARREEILQDVAQACEKLGGTFQVGSPIDCQYHHQFCALSFERRWSHCC